ncbi:MAG: 1-acyl-sn-glycerol-3-phosphate acyltransferase [Porticoccaceae bacterium]
MEYNYDDIRPYNDSEVDSVLKRLVCDDEFLRAIKELRFKWVPNWLFPLAKKFISSRLSRRISEIHNVHDFQLTIERYLSRCLLDTSRELEVSVEQALQPQKSYLFMSNHRDIAMDPAICNLACHRMGLGTFRIAIGDNLLTKPFASDLMRLNKSFIVKRNVESRREKLVELRRLSAYIRDSITIDLESVWIAQREGRAKDGCDKTDTALIKMLMLSKGQGHLFGDALGELHIIPVSISYEWDPCDLSKARELAAKERDGNYKKAEHEDILSIANGISGWKGRIDLHFGTEVSPQLADADAVAAEVDRQVVKNYRIQPSNAVAYEKLEGHLPRVSETWAEEELAEARAEMARRVDLLGDDPYAQGKLVQAYANPVFARLALIESTRPRL